MRIIAGPDEMRANLQKCKSLNISKCTPISSNAPQSLSITIETFDHLQFSHLTIYFSPNVIKMLYYVHYMNDKSGDANRKHKFYL